MMIPEPQLSDHVTVAFVQKVGPVTTPIYGDPVAFRPHWNAESEAMLTAVNAVLDRTAEDENLTILQWGEKISGRPFSLPETMFDSFKEH